MRTVCKIIEITYIVHREITLNKLTIVNVYFIKKVVILEKKYVMWLRIFSDPYAFRYYSRVFLKQHTLYTENQGEIIKEVRE